MDVVQRVWLNLPCHLTVGTTGPTAHHCIHKIELTNDKEVEPSLEDLHEIGRVSIS